MLQSLLLMGGLGVITGAVLAIASKAFYVYEDPTVVAVAGALPGANCGGCGYPGCNANAEAIVKGLSAVNSCVAAGSEVALEIAAIKSLEEAARTLDNVIKSLYTETDKTDHPDRASLKGLDSLKGLLNQPVRGKIISHFGAYTDPKYNVANFRSGIDIAAERGEPIKSVEAGKIIYSGWFKGYGNMIIIDHGESYYTVYAHLEENFKSKGDLVETEEVIATAGDAGSLSGPGLYFEMRHHGKPVDPVEWFKPS